MKKVLFILGGLVLAFAAIVPAFAQTAIACVSTQTVGAGDTLAAIAQKAYGDAALTFPIFSATNAQAISDKAFAFIDTPDELTVGSKVCIPVQPVAPAGLTAHDLQNATYKSDYGTNGLATLVNGELNTPVAGTELTSTVFASNAIAFGDLNGTPSAVIVLVENGGGSGVFSNLHVVQAKDGKPSDVASVLLGDRVNVTALAIQDGKIVVGMTTQGPNEPMCCGTQREWDTYALNGDQIVSTGTKVVGQVAQQASGTPAPTSAPAATLAGTVWKWTGSLFNDGSKQTPKDPNNYLLAFLNDGHVAVTADCNQVVGAYTTSGNQLTIALGPSTLVACPPGSLGDEFTRELGTVTSYFTKDGNLILEFKFDSGTMTFAPSATTGLPGTAWNVTSYNNGKHAVVSVISDSTLTLNFGTDGRVSGNAGCNNYAGGFDSSGDIVTVGPLATTFKLCHKPDGVMEQEGEYLTALQSSATYVISGNTLTIRDGSGDMQVVATQGAAAAGLPGTAWDVTGYNNGKEAVVSVMNGSAITMAFGTDNHLTGNSGCNSYGGSFESSDGMIVVGQLISTRKACTPDSVMTQEQQFQAALQKAATYEISGDQLILRDIKGAMQVTATRAAEPTLASTAWDVTGYNNGKQAVVSVIKGTAISLNFGNDNRVSGDASCNSYGGAFSSDATTLKVSQLISTQRACIGLAGIPEQEQQYLAALQNSATYDISGDMLTIRDASGAMQVTATRTTPPTLTGNQWSVTNINNGNQGVIGLLANTKITLNLSTDGTVNGGAGCNSYNGSFTSTETTLQVGPLATTRMVCPAPAGVMDQETLYLAALQNAATYEIFNNMLTIRDASGATQVIAVPVN